MIIVDLVAGFAPVPLVHDQFTDQLNILLVIGSQFFQGGNTVSD